MCRSGCCAEATAVAYVAKGGFHQSVHIWLPAGTLQSHDLFIHSDKHQKESGSISHPFLLLPSANPAILDVSLKYDTGSGGVDFQDKL